jgi:hypothetical protein
LRLAPAVAYAARGVGNDDRSTAEPGLGLLERDRVGKIERHSRGEEHRPPDGASERVRRDRAALREAQHAIDGLDVDPARQSLPERFERFVVDRVKAPVERVHQVRRPVPRPGTSRTCRLGSAGSPSDGGMDVTRSGQSARNREDSPR